MRDRRVRPYHGWGDKSSQEISIMIHEELPGTHPEDSTMTTTEIDTFAEPVASTGAHITYVGEGTWQ